MLGIIITIAVLAIGITIFIKSAPQFGKSVSGERLEAIRRSENYHNGQFQNQVETNLNIPARDMPALLMEFTVKGKEREPEHPLPTRFDYNEGNLDIPDSLVFVTWYGHSAILLEIEGKRILIDPMLGPAASPVPFMTKRFKYDHPIERTLIDNIDAVIISHDHYDHLDYPTIRSIKEKVGHFYTALAVGEHLKRWGVPENKITELDWWQETTLDHIKLIATPARHFSGRGITDRNKSQWASWVIIGKKNRIFFSGDSGYADHFKSIGEKYGPFDFTMVECGQYNERWEAIHMMPEQSVQAHIDLGGKVMMPIHWGAFNLSLHTWTDPIQRALAEADRKKVNIINPYIGQRFPIGQMNDFDPWWSETETKAASISPIKPKVQVAGLN